MALEEQYRLSCYEELTTLGDHNHIYLVKHKLSGEIFVKKVLTRFSFNIYKQLMDLQLSGIPTIYDMILDDDSLILIEEYIHGQTLEQLLNDQNTLIYSDALSIMKNGRRIHNNNNKKISCKILSSADLLLYFL